MVNLDKGIHMEISQISNQTLSTYSTQRNQNPSGNFELELEKASQKKLWGTNADGSQTAFYKADEKGNYIVKHTDKNGNESQKIINANNVNPTNANSDEMYALNLKENNKAGFEDTVLKVAMSEAKSRLENEYRGIFSKDTKLDSKALISDIIAQSSSNWDYENKAKWQNFLELLG